ncbi:MAG TPA: hypothetical protein VIL66_05710 [Bacillota bacterium]
MRKHILVLTCFILIFIFTAPAALSCHEEYNLQGLQNFLSDLKKAYEREDVNLFLSLFAPFSSATDLVRNTDLIYTKDLIRSELELSFASVSGLQVDFSETEILIAGNMGMVRTLRTLKAEETPFINARLVYTLQKKTSCGWDYGWGYDWFNQKWEIISQVLLDEWYDFTFKDLEAANKIYPEENTSSKRGVEHRRNPLLF